MLIRFDQINSKFIAQNPLLMFQISAELEYASASCSNFCEVCEMLKKMKEKFYEILLTCISTIAKRIFFLIWTMATPA